MSIKDHDLALSSPTFVDVLSARPRADLEREDRSVLLLRRERATAVRP
jgi:hypothetical protein